jgi:S-sulfo-L-cysteine synthase (3-phospho-L-serine-dependent)
VFNGEPIGITRKFLGEEPCFVETGHDFPAHLQTEIKTDILSYVRLVCKQVGIIWGPAHVELKLDSKSRPHIIEINPRLAGGFIPELVRLATGIDLIEETVRLSTGAELKLKVTEKNHASIRFIVPHEDGWILKVNGASQAGTITGIFDVRLYHSCPMVIDLRGDFRDRIGHVIAVSDARQDTLNAVETALDLISLSYSRANESKTEDKIYECA